MIYAAKTRATDGALTVGGINGKLLNPIYAFDNKAEFTAMLDHLWANGDNLIRIPRIRVVREKGRTFSVANDGQVLSEAEESVQPEDEKVYTLFEGMTGDNIVQAYSDPEEAHREIEEQRAGGYGACVISLPRYLAELAAGARDGNKYRALEDAFSEAIDAVHSAS